MKYKYKIKASQSGGVSLFVVLAFILLMSLMVLAIAQNAQREQRQALDRDLSKQAFTNSESGINDAAYYLYTTPAAPLEKRDCGPLPGISNVLGDVTNPNDVNKVNQYSCIKYDKAPKLLNYQGVGILDTKVIPLQPELNGDRLIIKWSDSAKRNNPSTINVSGCNLTPNPIPNQLPGGCDVGGVRIDLIPQRPAREPMINDTKTAFLLPSNVGGTIGGLGEPGDVTTGICDAVSKVCTTTITGLNFSNNLKNYLTIRSLYKATDISVEIADSSGNPIRLIGAQIMIDSTGKSNDILRRTQVKITANNQREYPGFALHSADAICKLINVTPGEATPSTACNLY